MLVVVVIPGYQFDGCDFGVDELNRAANPTVQIQGLVGSSEISDGAVTRCKLGISAFFWAGATGGPEAYLGAPCDGVNATNLVDGVWAIWKVPVDCASGASFKLGDTAAKNILVNRKQVGARYLKKDQLVCSQYNATLDGWEVHNIQQPVAPYAEPASKVHRGAPGPLPPAPAGTERVWTSRRGWTKVGNLITAFIDALFKLPATPYLGWRVDSTGKAGEWARAFDYHGVPAVALTLAPTPEPWNPSTGQFVAWTTIPLSNLLKNANVLVCRMTNSSAGNAQLFIKEEAGSTDYITIISSSTPASKELPFFLIRLDDNKHFHYMVQLSGGVPFFTIEVIGYII